jgi:hypothetical protein
VEKIKDRTEESYLLDDRELIAERLYMRELRKLPLFH